MSDTENDGTVSLFRRRIDQSEIDLYRQILTGPDNRPEFHLVMRAGDDDAAVVRCRATLASLAEQVYGEWTLHLVTRYRDADFGELIARLRDGTDNVRDLRQFMSRRLDDRSGFLARVLEGFEGLADRVRPMPRGGDDGFARFGTAGGNPIRSPLIAVLRAGDELSADALAELAVSAGLYPDAEFFYADEERPNCASGAVEAFCKPQWSPDLLLSTNYIGRLWCATGGLLARIGATVGELLRHGEYDLVLRCTEAAHAVQHIPAVLCRRGVDPLDSSEIEQRALARALDRRGIDGEIEAGGSPGVYRVKRRVTVGRRVSVIIPTHGARGLIKTSLDTLRRLTDYNDMEIIAVDDLPGTERAAKAWLRAHADKVIDGEVPFNWARHNNRAAKEAAGEFLLFLNDDVEIIEPGWLAAMLEHAARPEIGVVGPLLLYPDGTVQHAGMFLMAIGHARHAFRHQRRDAPAYFGLAQTQREVTAVTGACLLT
ncbi:MAG: glycosyltransferase family 2 protein, partial [Stellaceae bacterium]